MLYIYEDDCQRYEGCITVDNCSTPVVVKDLEKKPTCINASDGELVFKIRNEPLRKFTVHHVNFNGSTGSENNITIENLLESEVTIKITNLRAGLNTFRVITEQFCEKDIEITVPELLTDVRNQDRTECTEDVYCGGKLVYTRYPPKVELASEYCFVYRWRCSIKGSLAQSETEFDRNMAHSYLENVDGTCSFLYSCPDGEDERISGQISWEYEDHSCAESDESDLFLPQVQLGRYCKTNVAGETVSLKLNGERYEDAIETGESGECFDCTLDPLIPNKYGSSKEYSWTNSSGNTEYFDCCVLNPSCVPAKPNEELNIQSANQLLECYNEFGFKSCQFLNVSSGSYLTLNDRDIEIILQQIRNYGLVNAADLGYRFAPGSYALISSTCNTIRVTII
ncbi:MAG: hypothetical protein AB8F78_11270 [Saprospiraceae bacterium]